MNRNKVDLTHFDPEHKQRVTLFIDPLVIKRARARGAMEGNTLSEVVEKALDEYAPKIEKKSGNLNLNFVSGPSVSNPQMQPNADSTFKNLK